MTCELAQHDGAYVLGALSPEERLAFERHLDTCPPCSASVRDLAGLPGLLAQVSPEILISPPDRDPVPETLLPNLVAEVRRERRRRRWVGGLVAAAAVVVIGIATAVAVTNDDEPVQEPPVSSEVMVPIGQDAVEASVALTSVAWGTKLDLTCSYDVPAGGYTHEPPTYALVVRTTDGTEQVATWKGLPGKTMRLTGATALTTDQIVSVEVQDAEGHPLLELSG
jgi:predicted anti-sigma-YlaC factor YlaD